MKKIILFIAIISLSVSCKKEVKKKEQKQVVVEKPNYALLGKQRAMATKKVLGKNLKSTMAKKGTLAALQFCNVKAIPLTDSMSVVKKATIRRISDKNRNPNNAANTEELAHINTFKKMVSENKPVKPILKESENEITFYAPIITNGLCLQCHGTPNKEITPTVFKELQKLYPNDKAIGYSVNEVRGIWAITYQK